MPRASNRKPLTRCLRCCVSDTLENLGRTIGGLESLRPIPGLLCSESQPRAPAIRQLRLQERKGGEPQSVGMNIPRDSSCPSTVDRDREQSKARHGCKGATRHFCTSTSGARPTQAAAPGRLGKWVPSQPSWAIAGPFLGKRKEGGRVFWWAGGGRAGCYAGSKPQAVWPRFGTRVPLPSAKLSPPPTWVRLACFFPPKIGFGCWRLFSC